jgi:putative phosphoribosyl transferase
MVQISIPLDDSGDRLHGEFFIPKAAKGLIMFAHGSGSGRASPRNQHVANVLNSYGFATFLVDLLTQGEQQSDLKSQKILDKYPSLILNKFNIKLLARRLETATTWLIEIKADVKNLRIGYYGSSTGAAAAIEASILLDKVKAIVSRGGRPDLASIESIKNTKASTLLVVGAKDSKAVIDLNKKVLNQLKNAKSKELVMIPNAGHLFEEEGTIERIAELATKWFTNNL